MDKKQKLADMYVQVGQGDVSMATYNAALDNFYASDLNKEFHHPDRGITTDECAAIAAANLRYLNDGTCYDVTEESATGSVPTNNIYSPTNGSPLSVTPRYRQRILWQVPQMAQNNGWYCAPAAAAEVLRFWQVAYHQPASSYFGDSFSQSSLAAQCQSGQPGCWNTRGKYLMTDANGIGGTDWRWREFPWNPYSYMMEYGLNKWRQGAEHGDYAPIGLPQEDITFSRLQSFGDKWITDIDAAFPMVADVAENRTNRGVTSLSLPKHPTTRTIWHWFAIRGYSTPGWYDNYWYVHYVESVYGSSINNTRGYALTQGNNKVELLRLHTMFEVDGFGYVW